MPTTGVFKGGGKGAMLPQDAFNCEKSSATALPLDPAGGLSSPRPPELAPPSSFSGSAPGGVATVEDNVSKPVGLIYREGQNAQTYGHSSSHLNRFSKKFSPEYSRGKFAVKWLLKIAQHFAYVATLPCESCETLMSKTID